MLLPELQEIRAAVRDLLLAGDYHGMDLVLGAFDGMAIAEQTLQDVFLAPAGPDGIALFFLDLVKRGDVPGAYRLLADGADHQVAVGDSESAGCREVADDRLGLELDGVVA